MIYTDEELRHMGDINGDGVIDKKDVDLIKKAYGSRPGDPNWNPNCDLNGDGVVDLKDLYILASNFGKISTKYLYRLVPGLVLPFGLGGIMWIRA